MSVNFFLELLFLKKLILFLFSREFTFKFVFKVVTNIYRSYILILNSFQFSFVENTVSPGKSERMPV